MSNQVTDPTTSDEKERISFEEIDQSAGPFLYEDGFDTYLDACRNESIRHVWRKVLAVFRKKGFKLEDLLWCFSSAIHEIFSEADKLSNASGCIEQISSAMEMGSKLCLCEVLENGEKRVIWSNYPRNDKQ